MFGQTTTSCCSRLPASKQRGKRAARPGPGTREGNGGLVDGPRIRAGAVKSLEADGFRDRASSSRARAANWSEIGEDGGATRSPRVPSNTAFPRQHGPHEEAIFANDSDDQGGESLGGFLEQPPGLGSPDHPALVWGEWPKKESIWDGGSRGRKSQIREGFLRAKVRGFWDTQTISVVRRPVV